MEVKDFFSKYKKYLFISGLFCVTVFFPSITHAAAVVATVPLDKQLGISVTVGTKLFVASNNINDNDAVMYLIDRNTNTLLDTISLGGTDIQSMVVVGTKIYAANVSFNGGVYVIDTNTDTITSTIAVGINPGQATSVGDKVYVLNQGDNTVSVIDTNTDTVTGTIDVDGSPISSTLVGTKLYVMIQGSTVVSVIDTNTDTKADTITVGNNPIFATAVDAKLYVLNHDDGTISVVNTDTDSVTSTISGIGSIVSDSVLIGSKLYVSTVDENNAAAVSVIDTTTDTVEHTISINSFGNNTSLLFAVGTKLFVSNREDSGDHDSSLAVLSIFDTSNDDVSAGTIILGGNNLPFLVTAGTTAYVSGPGSVSVVDASGSGLPVAGSILFIIDNNRPLVGSLITGTYLFADPNGNPESGTAYQWLRSSSQNGPFTSILGANATTYTPTNADDIKYLEFQVTPRSASGTGAVATSTTDIVNTTQGVIATLPVVNDPVTFALVGTKLYDFTYLSNGASIIDTNTNTVIDTISVDCPKYSVVFNGKIYVTSRGQNSVSVIDTDTDSVVDTIPVGGSPFFITLLGTKAYVTNESDGTISVIDTTTDIVTDTITVGGGPGTPTAVGTKLYVLNGNDGTISVIDTTTDIVTDTITVGGGPNSAVLVGTKLYVLNGNDGTISVIDTTTDIVTDTITVGGGPNSAVLVGTKLYVLNGNDGTVSVIETNTNTVTSTIKVGDAPTNIVVVGKNLYIGNANDKTASVINTNTDTLVDTIAIGDSVSFDPAEAIAVGNKVYINNSHDSTLSVIDTTAILSQLPHLSSFTSTTADGVYGTGQSINITANFDQDIVSGSTMTVILNTGRTVVLNAASGNTLSGTYTVGGRDATADLAVSSIGSSSVTDTDGDTRTDYSSQGLPYDFNNLVSDNSAITRNIGDLKNIVVGNYLTVPVGINPYGISAGVLIDGTTYAYEANEGSGTVSVINTSTNAVTATIPVGTEPYIASVITASGTPYVYVINIASNNVSVINATTNTVIATIAVGANPYYSTAIGTHLYVTNSGSNTVSVIDAHTNTVTATISVGNYPLGIKAHGTDLYVANFGGQNYGGNTISVINSLNNTVTDTILTPAGSDGPRGVTVLGNKVYVTDYRSDDVSVIDANSNTITNTIPVGHEPRGIVGLGTNLYVGNFGDTTISVIDANSNTVTQTVDVGNSPASMSIIGSLIYYSRYKDNEVSILDTATNTLVPGLVTSPPPSGGGGGGGVVSSFAITNVSTVNSSSTSATVSWLTNYSADSEVDYGTTANYGQEVKDSNLTTGHSLSLSGLTPNATYYFQVKSTSSYGGSATASGSFAAGSSIGTVIPSNPTVPTTPTTPTPTQGLPYPSSPAISLINDNGTFYLIQNGQKQGVTSPGILFSYGLNFSDATNATEDQLSLPTGSLLLPGDGSLVKGKTSSTVYFISNGKKYGFVSADIFKALGFNFTSVLTVTDPELNQLPLSDNLTNPNLPHPDGTNILYHGTVYYISNQTRYPYPSLAVYNSWHIDNDFSQVVPANNADVVLPVGEVVEARGKK